MLKHSTRPESIYETRALSIQRDSGVGLEMNGLVFYGQDNKTYQGEDEKSLHGSKTSVMNGEVEITQEVEQNNSKLVIHRRLPTATSSDGEDDNLKDIIQKDFQKELENDRKKRFRDDENNNAVSGDHKNERRENGPPSPPLPFLLSPKRIQEELKQHKVQGYRTLDGDYRCKPKQSYNLGRQSSRPYQSGSSSRLEVRSHRGAFDTQSSTTLPRYYSRSQSAQPYYIRSDSRQASLSSLHSAKRENRLYNELLRNNNFRGSVYSVSTASTANQSRAISSRNTLARSTLGRSIILENITEDIELQRDQMAQESNEANFNKIRLQKCRCVAIFCTLLALIVCVVTGVLHFYLGFKTETVRINQADVHLVNISPSFCARVSAKAKRSGVRLISFQVKDKRTELQYTRSEKVTLFPQESWKRQFYLLKGSKVKFKVRTVSLVEMLVFTGEKNYTIWSQRKESDTYYKKKECCSNVVHTAGDVVVAANRDEQFIFAVHSNVEVLPVSVSVELEFTRHTYDFKETRDSCTSGVDSECSVAREFDSNTNVAVEVPLLNDKDKISRLSEVEWQCEARVWFYCVLFAGIFIVLYLIIFAVYIAVSKLVLPRFKKKEERIGYYDNFGQAMSDSASADFMPYSLHATKLPIVDARSTISKQTRSPRTASTYLRSLYVTRSPYKLENQTIAALYSDQVVDKDSGISDDPDVSPNNTQAIRDHSVSQEEQRSRLGSIQDLMQLQNMRHDHLKDLQRKQQLVSGPRIEQVISRASSEVMEPVGGTYYKYPNELELQNFEPEAERELFI